MLINKQPDILANDIVSFRLANGDEVIGKVVQNSHEDITITRPIVGRYIAMGQNAAIGFEPFMISVDEDSKHTFNKKMLSSSVLHTKTEIKNKYIKMTSGLEVASSIPETGIIK